MILFRFVKCASSFGSETLENIKDILNTDNTKRVGRRLFRTMEKAINAEEYDLWDRLYTEARKANIQECGKINSNLGEDYPIHLHFNDGYIEYELEDQSDDSFIRVSWKAREGLCTERI